MPNLDPHTAWIYHNATKHSYRSIRDHAHFLDWANQPVPFKVYPALELLPLPREVRPTGGYAYSHGVGPSLEANSSPLITLACESLRTQLA